MGVALSLPFQCSTKCEMKKTDAVPFLFAKVVRGLWLFSSQALNNSSKGLCRLVCLENLHTYGLYFPTKPCASLAPLPWFCYKKDELLRALPAKSAYSDLWTHKKMSLWISKKELEEGDRRESQIQHLRWTAKDIAPPLITALTLWLEKVCKCW